MLDERSHNQFWLPWSGSRIGISDSRRGTPLSGPSIEGWDFCGLHSIDILRRVGTRGGAAGLQPGDPDGERPSEITQFPTSYRVTSTCAVPEQTPLVISTVKVWEFIFSEKGLKIWLGNLNNELEIKKEYITDNGTEGLIRVFKPNSHIRLSWKPKHWENRSTIQIRVIDNEDKTTVAIHHENLLNSEQRVEMKLYWNKIMTQISEALNNPVDKKDNSAFADLKQIFEKSLVVNKDLKAGDVINFDDLEAKKPKGYGINASDYKLVIGKKINRNLNQWDFLNKEDIL